MPQSKRSLLLPCVPLFLLFAVGCTGGSAPELPPSASQKTSKPKRLARAPEKATPDANAATEPQKVDIVDADLLPAEPKLLPSESPAPTDPAPPAAYTPPAMPTPLTPNALPPNALTPNAPDRQTQHASDQTAVADQPGAPRAMPGEPLEPPRLPVETPPAAAINQLRSNPLRAPSDPGTSPLRTPEPSTPEPSTPEPSTDAPKPPIRILTDPPAGSNPSPLRVPPLDPRPEPTPEQDPPVAPVSPVDPVDPVAPAQPVEPPLNPSVPRIPEGPSTEPQNPQPIPPIEPQPEPQQPVPHADPRVAAAPGGHSGETPTGKPALPGHGSEPFDPLKVNGPIFVGWPKPKAALVITGCQEGYIEPCGCAGLDRMKGGMARRHTMFEELRKKGWPVVGIDAGGIAKGFGRQAELKFQIMVEGMRKMNYDAITFGKTDLRLPAMELLAITASDDAGKGPFLSANIVVFDPSMTAKMLVLEAGGMKIGVTGILGKKYQEGINNQGLQMIAPEAGLKEVVPKLKQQCDMMVLLAHATMEETIALAKQFPDFQIVVTAGGAPVPPSKIETIAGTKTKLVEVGHKGMDVLVLGLYDDPNQPIRYQRVPLDSRFANSTDMELLMGQYQDQLKHLGFAGLGIRPIPHPQAGLLGKFVGSKKCETCHEESYKIWKKTPHAKAYATLENLKPPRTFDPECISCHVIGWHPTKYFPYAGGYESKPKTPHLAETGCEDCHGPGSNHIKAESGADTALQEKIRKAMVLTKEDAEEHQCVSCHDGDNSPAFDFDLYWPHIEHYEDIDDEEDAPKSKVSSRRFDPNVRQAEHLEEIAPPSTESANATFPPASESESTPAAASKAGFNGPFWITLAAALTAAFGAFFSLMQVYRMRSRR